ncbi:hypothetical protein Tco_1075068, partial [Tanacetum coccineum]
MSGENDQNWMARVEILYRAHMRSDFKHKSAWAFLKDKHKRKNPDSTNARRNRHRVTDKEPELFGDEHCCIHQAYKGLLRVNHFCRRDSTFCAMASSHGTTVPSALRELDTVVPWLPV